MSSSIAANQADTVQDQNWTWLNIWAVEKYSHPELYEAML